MTPDGMKIASIILGAIVSTAIAIIIGIAKVRSLRRSPPSKSNGTAPTVTIDLHIGVGKQTRTRK